MESSNTKRVITVEIDEKACRVFYQKGEEARKPWTECSTQEIVEIYAASRVLAKGTQIQATFELSGLNKELEEIKNMLNPSKSKR